MSFLDWELARQSKIPVETLAKPKTVLGSGSARDLPLLVMTPTLDLRTCTFSLSFDAIVHTFFCFAFPNKVGLLNGLSALGLVQKVNPLQIVLILNK